MAVRDQERQPKHAARQSGTRAPWIDTLGHLPGALIAGGVLMYGFLSICYDRFYGFLGVDPNDVGLSYTGTLARSSGFVVIAFLFGSTVVYGVRRGFLGHGYEPGLLPIRWRKVGGALLAILPVLYLVVWPLFAADRSAAFVRSGRPISPVQFPGFLPFTMLAIHADPATVEPVGKPGDSPAAERLRGRKLLYLGQASGTLVLYDAVGQQAIYLPAGSIILRVANCDGKSPPDPSCAEMYRF